MLVALRKDPAYVMSQMGHTSTTMTLGVYAHVMLEDDRERLRQLVEGAHDGRHLALAGTGACSEGQHEAIEKAKAPVNSGVQGA